MPRSRSPPPRRRDRDDREYSRRDDRGYSRGGDRGHPRRSDRDDEDSKYGPRREYGEKDRERERERDRDRYERRRDDDRRRDGDGRGAEGERRDSRRGSERRSASPRRDGSQSAPPEDKGKPNYKPSGLLAAETNTVKTVDGNSTLLKYNEPPEARKPVQGWRLYVFKGAEQVELLHVNRQSAYLIGRDRLVADIYIEHPSCSKQHAVIQYRHIKEKNEFGEVKGVVKPFIIDLESTNGTQVNDERIPESRYYELKLNDVIKFGTSAREYVLLHDDVS
ncbi:SMAD/FHA domain-containing protein [Schizophyllum amplum]|uniref:SMAD/FHA domain-containing protein n=1 Tax=Schizophyllum amplum TaxID=97359 RepID=A0A550CGU5_9AGAR|nr:SMAD/FHA domain-containing protein [Auriculariopsis ampla]